MTRTRVEEWEVALRQALDAVDHALEERFGDLLPPHPNRPRRHATANPKYDGLFAVDSKFSMGLVSRSGPGYIIDVRMVSTRSPDPRQREEVMAEAQRALTAALETAFPGRHLHVTRDGQVLRVTGDLSL